ncbi:MAG: hypothetical protein ACOY3I_09360 [Verrucomicrobiota bacterium]
MVWRFLRKGILVFLVAWQTFIMPLCAQNITPASWESPATTKRITRRTAQIIAVSYIIFASGALVFLFSFAFKMRRKHKKHLQKYSEKLTAKRASIHNEEPIFPEPVKILIRSQPLLDPAIARLAFLKDLQTQGLISEFDYERQKARILEHF